MLSVALYVFQDVVLCFLSGSSAQLCDIKVMFYPFMERRAHIPEARFIIPEAMLLSSAIHHGFLWRCASCLFSLHFSLESRPEWVISALEADLYVS